MRNRRLAGLLATVLFHPVLSAAPQTDPSSLAVASASPTEHGSPQAWAISFDNDLLAPRHTDRDYTAGFALTYAGRQGVDHWRPLDNTLGWVDRSLGLDRALPDIDAHTPAIEFGVYGFTPEDIDQANVVHGDRPYASLVYLSNSRSYVNPKTGDGWTSSLTLGMLGLDVFKGGQNAVHQVLSSEKARGWDHQVSDGGEPTLRYSLAYHDYLDISTPSSKFKATYYASAGYLTEAGVALTFRDGLISSPDNRFNPELTAYGERVNETSAGQARESYFWGGVALKARAYNAFLEGQFRHSDYTIDRSDVRPLLAEAWLGYTHSLGQGYKLSYVARVQSSEVDGGDADRTLAWGGLIFSKTLN
ncbi:lipid A deacylase LpxR family protein [Marinobacter sp. JSM 1782161]|uniref:lipid A deacylase LpxR family protein n=1 Tax=Marinobacter sp. JSM 1782161 TaxID=2685906 RepID=UPI001402EA35|nr:lipid A deacylase LpxR family protein [Marinobacter sp. JSM 1782161]